MKNGGDTAASDDGIVNRQTYQSCNLWS